MRSLQRHSIEPAIDIYQTPTNALARTDRALTVTWKDVIKHDTSCGSTYALLFDRNFLFDAAGTLAAGETYDHWTRTTNFPLIDSIITKRQSSKV